MQIQNLVELIRSSGQKSYLIRDKLKNPFNKWVYATLSNTTLLAKRLMVILYR